MFALRHRKQAIRAVFLFICVIATITAIINSLIANLNHNKTFAATGDGDTVTVLNGYNDEQHFTNFQINNGSSTHQAYCAQTSVPGPNNGTTWQADFIDVNEAPRANEMKLLMFINQYSGTNTYANDAKNAIFNSWPGKVESAAWYTKYTHYMLSIMYSNDWAYVEEESIPYVNNAISYLENSVRNKTDVWIVANNYTIYRIRPGEGIQDIVWIEDNTDYGSISVKKLDAETGSTPQGSASLAGIRFEVYNASGHKIYNPKTNIIYDNNQVVASGTTNENGEITFSQLLANNTTYIVKETATNAWYQLNATERTVTLATNGETITINHENNIKRGNITVNKTDSETGTCTSVGNLSLVGTVFDLYNSTGGAIKYNNQTYADGAKIDSKTITNECSITFSNLPYGKYTVKEASASAGYTADSSQKEVTISTASSSVNFSNTSIKGKITINKTDKDTGSCKNSARLSFNGVTFSITNNSTNPIKYQGEMKAVGAIIDTKTMTADECNITFEGLPYGSYIIKETQTSEGYAPNTTTRNITIPTNNRINVTTTFENQPIRGDVKFVKMDASNNRPMANVLFSISSVDSNQDFQETHIAVSDNNGVVNTSNSFNRHSYHTNGYDPLYDGAEPIIFSGYGTWFGLDEDGEAIPVRDDVGALPYGTYVIQELRCDSNLFCYNINDQKKTITINSANQVIDLGDWDNTCAVFSLGTVATDAKDDDKYIEVEKEAKLKDTIDYCVKPNLTFVIKGILMDKSTGEPLLINGETIESSIELTSDEECGQTEMFFDFDASELAGKEIVVFESLYYNDELITDHKDINDPNQTIDIISLYTYATNKATDEKILPLDEDVIIKDLVKYCLKPNQEYTIKGVLMNKATGEKLIINGEPTEAEITFTPEETCGETEMYFSLNTKDLGGTDLVIFESLYYDEEVILEHNNINNPSETVSVAPPTPDTGQFQKSTNSSKTSGTITIIYLTTILGVFGYGTKRIISKKNFLKRR